MKDLGVTKNFGAYKYIETGNMASFGFHNISMWRRYL